MKRAWGQVLQFTKKHYAAMYVALFALSVLLGALTSSTPACVDMLGSLQAPSTAEFACHDGECVPINLRTTGGEKMEGPGLKVESSSDRGVFGSCMPPMSWGIWFVVSAVLLAALANWSEKSLRQSPGGMKSARFGWWFVGVVSIIATALLLLPHFRFPGEFWLWIESIRASFLEMTVPAIISVFPLISIRKRRPAKSQRRSGRS